MDESHKYRAVLVGEEDAPVLRSLKRHLRHGFPNQFEIEHVPFLRPTESSGTPTEHILRMHQERPLSLVVLFDDSISHESHEATKDMFLTDIHMNIEVEADRIIREQSPPEPIIIVESKDVEEQSFYEGQITEMLERQREEIRATVIAALKEKREAALNLFLNRVPNDAGTDLVRTMRDNESALKDIPLIITGLYPERKEIMEILGGNKTIAFSSSDFGERGVIACEKDAERFIREHIMHKQPVTGNASTLSDAKSQAETNQNKSEGKQ